MTRRPLVTLAALAATLGGTAGLAAAQSATSAAFVLNNVSDTVTAWRIQSDGSLVLADDEPASDGPQCADLSPNGRWLAVGHATSSTTTEILRIYEVAADASLTLAAETTVPDSPLDCAWASDAVLCVSKSSFGGPNLVQTFLWDGKGTVTPVGDVDAGTFHTSLAVHPTLPLVYAQDSFGFTVQVLNVDPDDGTITVDGSVSTNRVYPLDLTVSPDGNRMYAGGGISSDGDKILAWSLEQFGLPAELEDSPFTSAGQSPAYTCVSADNQWLVVGHGTDATVRTFAIAGDGAPVATGFSFDVGLQGTVGDVTAVGPWILVTDESTAIDGVRGLYVFEIGASGELVATGPPTDVGGVRPETIVGWAGGDEGPEGDVTGDGIVGFADLLALLAGFGGSDPLLDLDGSGLVDFADVLIVLSNWTDP